MKKTHSVRRTLAPKRSNIEIHLSARVENKAAPNVDVADPDLPPRAGAAGLNVDLAIGRRRVDVGAGNREGVEAERQVVKAARLVDGGRARRAAVTTVLHRGDVRHRRGSVSGRKFHGSPRYHCW